MTIAFLSKIPMSQTHGYNKSTIRADGVDDLLIAVSDDKVLSDLKKSLNFRRKDFGQLSYFLGIDFG